MRILLVDDTELIRETFQSVLESNGHEVVCAVDGIDGITKFDPSFDMIITDMEMPKMTGLELITSIREFSEVPIAMVSGSIEEALPKAVESLNSRFYNKMEFTKLVKSLEECQSA